jgi:hypothetical protein
MTGKMSTSKAAATITATQTAKAKKKKRKKTGPVVSTDTATVSSGVETINIDDEEDDAKSPDVVAAPSTEMPRKAVSMEERATETPRRTFVMEERPMPRTYSLGDAGSQKRRGRPLLSPASLV